ncbi:MAG: DUF4269 domain-containing protein, partial [bacterium]
MRLNLRDISFLRCGTKKQETAYRVLQELQLFSVLRKFDPVFVSTVAIGVDVDGSDLDIICEVHDFVDFRQTLETSFGHYDHFQVWRRDRGPIPAMVAKFSHPHFPIEVFGQSRPVEKQNAYRHLMVCNRLLRIGGEKARQQILALRGRGMKTEPAFA